MRLGDLDALSAFVGDLRSTLHKEQSTFKAMTQSEFEIKDSMLLSFQYAIDNAQTVERPQGEWITHRVAFHLTCPFCGCNLRALKNKVFEGDYDYNFCPNCGAEMLKEEES